VTVGFGMRNIPDTILALKEIRRVLRPGGKFICLELTQPQTPILHRLYSWYLSRFMPFVSNLVMNSSAPYLYLPRSIEAFYQPPEFREVIARSGFHNVAIDSLTLGIATVYRASKRGSPDHCRRQTRLRRISSQPFHFKIAPCSRSYISAISSGNRWCMNDNAACRARTAVGWRITRSASSTASCMRTERTTFLTQGWQPRSC